MRLIKRLIVQEDGIAMATILGVIAVLTVTSIVLTDQVLSEFHNATGAVNSNAVYQTAEAGIGDYVSKLNEDPLYFDHQVGKGEATRQSCASYSNGSCISYGTLVVSPVANGQAAQAWKTGTHWGYPNGADNFFSGTGNTYGNSTVLKGYAYDLMVTPPSSSLKTTYISVLSTGCKLISGGTTCDPLTPKQSILTRVSRSNPANFQYMVPDMSSSSVCFASNLYGIVYSVGTIKVCGADAYGNLLAETSVSGSVNLISPAKIYTPSTNPSIRTQVPQPVSFSQLTISLASLKRAAALNSPSTVFDDSSAAAWQINFSSNGTFQVWKCVFVSGSGGTDPAYSEPYCDNLTLATATRSGGTTTITTKGGTDGLPSSGTIYIGPNSSGKTDTFNYSSLSSTATTATFKGSPSLTFTHSANERVSYYSSAPWAEPYYTGPLPPNNAIYTGQDAVVSWPTAVSGSDGTSCPSYVGTPASAVNGRVTVGSNTDVIVAGDLCYSSQASGVNDDVLGVVANGNVWIADYTPINLWWRSATIALNGTWGDYDCTNSKGSYRGSSSSMTFVGTAAYKSSSGCMQSGTSYGFNIDNVNRVADDGSMATINACPSTAPDCASYNALQFLFPPWFPVLNGEKIGLFQEVKPSTLLPVG